ncbi:MAG: YggS family pyridoxal phosphate-dependent enzyme [Actinomycetota bacterium]
MTQDVVLAEGLRGVRSRIDAACLRSGRSLDEVTLVAVTKTVPSERIAAAVALGVRDVGENRVQEMLDKQRALVGIEARWHFIGTLQRNKVGAIVGRTVLVHGIDSVRLARALAARAEAAGVRQDVLVEINVSGESSKHGVLPSEALRVAVDVASLSSLRLRGLMTMAPAGDPAMARRAFAGLRELRDLIAREVDGVQELSMGMSGDFEIAVEEGATVVRVGSAIFGARVVPERREPEWG